MIDEVGAIGYYGNYKILDSHGLLSPEVIPYLKKFSEDYNVEKKLIEIFKPNWIFNTRHVNYLKNRDSKGEKIKFKNYTLFDCLSSEESPFILELWRKNKYQLKVKKKAFVE